MPSSFLQFRMGNSEGIHRSGKCGGGKEIFKKIHGADNI